MGAASYRNGFEFALHERLLDAPLRWKRPRTIFVNSMSDLFHGDVPLEFILRAFEVMRGASRHRFQVLTERAERLGELDEAIHRPAKVWMGVSVESPTYIPRIEHLRRTRARVRFLSLEPLLAALPGLDPVGIDWVIMGGESGPGARPMREEWALDIRDQCLRAGVPFFLKQWGGVWKKRARRRLAGRTWDQVPNTAVIRPTENRTRGLGRLTASAVS